MHELTPEHIIWLNQQGGRTIDDVVWVEGEPCVLMYDPDKEQGVSVYKVGKATMGRYMKGKLSKKESPLPEEKPSYAPSTSCKGCNGERIRTYNGRVTYKHIGNCAFRRTRRTAKGARFVGH